MTIIRFLKRLKNRTQFWFSKRPIIYGFVGGIGVVLFWRGVWHTADALSTYFALIKNGNPTTDFVFSWDGPVSILIGTMLLLFSGLFVSAFLGSEITISGLRGEKSLSERIESEVHTETGALHEIRAEIRKVRERLEKLDEKTKPPV